MKETLDKYWQGLLDRYMIYLKLERSLSEASVEAYLCDIRKFLHYALPHYAGLRADDIHLLMLESFLRELNETGIGLRTQARLISGLRSFFNFLVMEQEIQVSPATLLEIPRVGRRLPEVLSVNEIDLIESQIDLSRPGGHRDRAILEVMYGCGLRVSEVLDLRISNIFREEGFVRITGKGSKERLIPINGRALREIDLYLPDRHQMTPDKENSDILFLNRLGHKLSRVYLFKLVKELARKAGIRKNVSPHTFRHSFATHLMEGGADLRAIQEMLGHESIQTTEIYTHLDKEYLRSTILEYHPRS